MSYIFAMVSWKFCKDCKFNPVFDPNKDIMLGIEGIKLGTIIRGS